MCSLVGTPITTTCSALQKTYFKDSPLLTGKFGLELGKGTGSACQLEITDDVESVESLLAALETGVTRLIEQRLPVATYEYETYAEALTCCPLETLKKPPKEEVTVCHVAGVIAAIPTGPVLANTGMLKSIKLVRKDCKIVGNKKAKNCKLDVKFVVEVSDEAEVSAVTGGEIDENGEDTDAPVKIAVEEVLLTNEIRLTEGKLLLELQQTKQAAEEAVAAAAAASTATAEKVADDAASDEMVVDPFTVSGIIDYNKLVENFGSKKIPSDLLSRLETIAKSNGVTTLHRFLRRNVFFSHRDLDKICTCVENKQPIYLYTGRGPSSGAMHLGHLVPFLMTQWLQRALNCPLVIQMTDDEKFLFKGVYQDGIGDNLDYFRSLTIENAKDIIACGFDFDKTFLFSDVDYVGRMYPTIVRIWKSVTQNQVTNIFGFDGQANIGKVAFPAIQAAPSFPTAFPVVLNAKDRTNKMACLIPCAIDQDPYFRMTRDVAHKLVDKHHPLGGKPALIHSKFFPPLQGAKGKMSSSDGNSAVFLTDSPELIAKKIREHAFSGGRDTKAEQLAMGANLDVDVSYQWLRFFMEDDEELERIGKEYGSGTGEFWSTGLVKARLIQLLQDLVMEHQKRRALVTNDVVQLWMKERCLV